jgi:SNF2 family DNA or RNA helicase
MAEDPEEVAEAEARGQLPRGPAAVPRFHVLLTTFELASKVGLARLLLLVDRHGVAARTMLVTRRLAPTSPPTSSEDADSLPAIFCRAQDQRQLRKFPWSAQIIDEGHRLKSETSMVSNTLSSLSVCS